MKSMRVRRQTYYHAQGKQLSGAMGQRGKE